MMTSFSVWWRGLLGAALCVGALLCAAAGLASDAIGAWAIGVGAAAGAALVLWWAHGLLGRERALREQFVGEIDRLQRAAGAEPDAALAAGDLALAVRRAEAAIVASLEADAAQSGDLRSLLDAVEDAVIAFDSQGLVRMTNRAADTFFEREPGRLLGHTIEELFSQADLIALYSDAARGTVARGLVRIARSGGVRTYQVAATPFSLAAAVDSTGDRRPVAITFEDVTEFATAVQHKTEFVANASHELRTPLASIRGAAETLMDAAGDLDTAMAARLLTMISSNARRLEELVSDLADLSRLESPEATVVRSAISLRELCHSIGALFERSCAERSLTLQLDIAPQVERIESDPRLLTLILKNLVENATKFAHDSTPIVVAAHPIPGPGRAGLSLRVIDRGIGIPLSAQARIFERFYQVDSSRSGQAHRRGTGLGLAIVKHAVKTLGGTISVSSVWKEGTTMTVELPACALEPDNEPAPALERSAAGHSPASGA